MNNLFTTGEFAKASNTTKQTLFHYDEIDLLPPHFKDENGYRYYSYQQFDMLIVIDILKELGMKLKEIKQFMETNSPNRMIELFKEKSTELARKIDTLNQIQKVIHTRIAITEQAQKIDVNQITIEIIEKEYLFLSDCIIDYSDYEFVRSASTFIEVSDKRNLNIGYPIGAMVSKDKIELEDYANYSFLYTRVERNQKSVPLYEKLSGLYVIGYHIGDYEGISKTYDRLLTFIENHSLMVKDFAYEEYVLDAVAVGQVDEYVTKISIAVEQEMQGSVT